MGDLLQEEGEAIAGIATMLARLPAKSQQRVILHVGDAVGVMGAGLTRSVPPSILEARRVAQQLADAGVAEFGMDEYAEAAGLSRERARATLWRALSYSVLVKRGRNRYALAVASASGGSDG